MPKPSRQDCSRSQALWHILVISALERLPWVVRDGTWHLSTKLAVPSSVSRCHCVFSSSRVIHLVSCARSFQEVALHYFHDLPMSDIKTQMKTICQPNGQRAVTTEQVALSRHGKGSPWLCKAGRRGHRQCAGALPPQGSSVASITTGL